MDGEGKKSRGKKEKEKDIKEEDTEVSFPDFEEDYDNKKGYHAKDDFFDEEAGSEEISNFIEEEEEIIPGREDSMRRLKKVAKLIDILEFVDSCLIVGERFVRDDEDAKGVIREIREKILTAETLLTDYLITGKMPKIQ